MNSKIKLSVKTKLLVFALGIGLSIAIIMGRIAFSYFESSIRTAAIDRITVAREEKRRQIELLLTQAYQEFSRLAENISSRDTCHSVLAKSGGKLFLLGNSGGRPLCSVAGSVSHHFPAALEKFSMLDDEPRFFEWDNELLVLRKIDKNRFLVYLVDPELFNQVMTQERRWERAGFGKTGETYLVGFDHRMRTDSRFLPKNRARPFVDTVAFARAAAGEVGVATMPDYRGIPVFSAFAPITFPKRSNQGFGWVVLSEVDVDEVYAPLHAFFRSILLAISVALSLFAIGAWWLAKSFSAPLIGLVGITRKVKAHGLSGDPFEGLGGRSDEFGVLAQEFGSMIVSLREKEIEHGLLQRRLIEFEEVEKQRLGQDLHDLIGQDLVGVSYLLKWLQDKSPSAHLQDFEKISTLVKQSISRVRSLSSGLCPVQVENEGLVLALRDLAKNTTRLYDIACTYTGIEEATAFLNEEANLAYRIVQEAVSNAVKHAKAKKIEIKFSVDHSGCYSLEVRDDGQGLHPAHKAGLGRYLMELRAQSLRATLSFESPPNCGTNVICRVPRSVGFSLLMTTSLSPTASKL